MKISSVLLMAYLAASCSSSNFAGGPSTSGKKSASSDDNEDDPADEPQEVAGTFTKPDDHNGKKSDPEGELSIDPESLVLFKGDTADARAFFKGGDDEKDVTDDSSWKAKDTKIAEMTDGSEFIAREPGETKIIATYKSFEASLSLTVVKCKETSVDESTQATMIKIDGENWPNNTVDPGGGDKDDYHITIKGQFLVDGFQIYAKDDQDITVNYALGTPGSTTQTVSLAIIDCDGTVLSNNEVSTGSGSHVLKAKKGQRFTLITTAKTGSLTRTFQLDKDTADATAADSFRVTIQ